MCLCTVQLLVYSTTTIIPLLFTLLLVGCTARVIIIPYVLTAFLVMDTKSALLASCTLITWLLVSSAHILHSPARHKEFHRKELVSSSSYVGISY